MRSMIKAAKIPEITPDKMANKKFNKMMPAESIMNVKIQNPPHKSTLLDGEVFFDRAFSHSQKTAR
ncbi:hypothetical protein C900_00225 [Fulvivirga imtechensis AK7]|uniref:Uncharacterized protein n=1 Tax=Fulvivirga imtechensis AK7 TaxID=1237149 RepID=L8JI88_9BACT|nr:hypothetical protein C900_00225 [Fulvivirga imtechensis AK7]